MSTFSITSLDGKRCTAVPKQNNLGGGQTTTTSSTSTTSIFTSTSISTSSTSISSSTSTSTTLLDTPLVQAPNPGTPTSTQEALTSTTSSTSPQSVIPSTTPIPSATETSAPPIPPSIPSSVATESLVTSSTAHILDSPASLSSQTTDQDLVTTSQTNDSLAPTTTSDVSSSVTSSDVAAGGTTATTTGAGQIESANAGASLTNGAQNVSKGAISTQTTVAVAGGVIGGLAVISIIAFLLWFWRKRLMKKRRSTLLTPLSTGAGYNRGEKGPYIISRNSLGPTTIPEKVKAVVGYNYHRLRGRVNSLVTRSPKPSVDLNRGNSQFGLPDTPASRSSSRAGMASNGAMTAKGRFVDWWGRLTEDGNLNWKLRGDPKSERPNNDTYTSMSNTAQNRRRGSQPDFLTLLSMDEKQQQGATNVAGSSKERRSQSLGNDHFLGGLGLNFDTANPFADSNAMSHDSAKVMPLAVIGAAASDPFSDANAIPAPGPARSANNNSSSSGAGGPATYVQNIRRSRGHSVSAANMGPPSAATVAAAHLPSMYRESSVSVETSDTRRNKFRSDPFDLDRPELLAQSPRSSTRGVAGRQSNARGLPNMPRPTHARVESFTSKYSSGVSMAEWSDPGPDVGPAAGRWDTPSPDGALGRRPPVGDAPSVEKGKGKGSVGKAM